MKTLQILAILLFTSYTSVFSQNTFQRQVDFKFSQDGVSLSGSATVAAEFVFFGYPYLKVKYSNLTIKDLSYKNMYFNNFNNRDILAFPFKPANGGYYVSAEMFVTIAYVDAKGGLVTETGLGRLAASKTIKTFTIKDKIYTVADTYSEQAIDDYFRELNHQKYSDSDFWENSALYDAKITGLSPNIIRQMTTIIDAKLREKEEEKEKEKEKKKDDKEDFNDFLSGNEKSNSNKTTSGDDFDDFLSGNKVAGNNPTSTNDKDDFDDFLSGEKTTKASKPDNEEGFDDFLNGTQIKKSSDSQKTSEEFIDQVKIGNQIWHSENLDISTLRDGTPIKQAKTKSDWFNAHMQEQPVWSYYNFDETNKMYGKLYNWHAVNTGKLCPSGWKIPTRSEFRILVDYTGYDNGHRLMSKAGWKVTSSHITDITNELGFSALPAGIDGLVSKKKATDYGFEYGTGSFGKIGEEAFWWSDTPFERGDYKNHAIAVDLSVGGSSWFLETGVIRNRGSGLSCRCIKE